MNIIICLYHTASSVLKNLAILLMDDMKDSAAMLCEPLSLTETTSNISHPLWFIGGLADVIQPGYLAGNEAFVIDDMKSWRLVLAPLVQSGF